MCKEKNIKKKKKKNIGWSKLPWLFLANKMSFEEDLTEQRAEALG